jgi:hypothetical protein
VTVLEQISRLRLRAGQPSNESDLSALERLSGLKLPAAFRELWLTVGGCVVAAKIRAGNQVGQDVAEFWEAGAIIDKLREDRLPRVLPFGEDAWGNWFFIDELGAIGLVDWNANRVEPVSQSFDSFLDSLDPVSSPVG